MKKREQWFRGFLIEAGLDPDEDYTGKIKIDLEWINRTRSSDIMEAAIADAWDKREHPQGWSGQCYQCYILDRKLVFHKFISKNIAKILRERGKGDLIKITPIK